MPKELENQEVEETQPEIDVDAATAEISSELFGQGDDGEGDNPTAGEEDKSSDEGAESTAVDAVETPPQTDEEKAEAERVAAEAEAVNSAEVQDIGAPKTWTKEALAEWATIPPRAQAEILKREEDFLKGITQYKEAADLGVRYSQVVQPFAPMLAAEGVDPVGLFQSFAANHYLLSRGRPEQKIELAAQLINGYNIPLAELLEHIAEHDSAAPVDPQITALRQELNGLKSEVASRSQAETAQYQTLISNEIENFAADPAHPYFDEVADDIRKLFESGMASNLAEAYEKAIYTNPVTRQKEIDRLTAERTSQVVSEKDKRKDKIAKATADNVRSIPKARDGTVPTGSIDDTLAETMAAIESRG